MAWAAAQLKRAVVDNMQSVLPPWTGGKLGWLNFGCEMGAERGFECSPFGQETL